MITGALLDGGGLAKIVGKRAQNLEQVGVFGDFFKSDGSISEGEVGLTAGGASCESGILPR